MTATAQGTEVLVVGAGPVGLMVAGELTRRGVSTRIIDRAVHRSPESRALVVHARTLELMDLAGLSDRFIEAGYPAPGLAVGLGQTAQISVDMRTLDTRYPYMLVLPQQDTERILTDALTTRGVEIERGSTLLDLAQSTSGVAATVETHDGSTELIQAKYLVGCDGSHSSVRRILELPFEGHQHGELVLIGDVKADMPFARTRITNFTSPRGFVSILPFLGDYVRVFAVDFTQQHHERAEELSLAELQSAVDGITSTEITLSEPTWLTRYTAPSRHVGKIRDGRVFLAGDAAHSHSPAGGQGMNTGLQDAVNLGWKLAMVLGGYANPEVLDSYNTERSPVHQAVLEQTDRMFRTFVIRNAALRALRNMAARALVPRPFVQRRLAKSLSGLAVRYPASPAVSSASGIAAPEALKPGARIPDVALWRAGRPPVRLYEILREGGYAMLVYAESDRVNADLSAIADLAHKVSSNMGSWVRAYVVLDEGVLDDADVDASVFVDITGGFKKKFGAIHRSVLLVRPDAYLAAHQVGLEARVALTALRHHQADPGPH
ncbi:FAD-dependent monooxygenase [Mycolicibacterium mageritense]|uniref:FAD-dependent monooxygenase n=1 Tax=Mycolicibacterium mageritense TaxID=53462 RepID=UPI0023F2FE56|nr:FAD-dependent monooxygenase [Mycolicibacterium mageritense]